MIHLRPAAARLRALCATLLLLAGPALGQASLPPYVPPAPIQDLGAPSSCPFILGVSGQSVAVGQDHNGPHNAGQNVYVANSVQSPTGFVPAAYGAAPFNLGPGGTVSDPALAYVNPGMAAAYYLRQAGLIPADRPIVLVYNAVGAQSISDWIDGAPFDLWTPLAQQYTLLNAGAVASDGRVLTRPGTRCPIAHQTWNQGQADGSGAYGSQAAYLAGFDRLVTKFQALPNWSPQTRMTVAEMGTWPSATGSARNDAIRTLANGCRYPFVTALTSAGMANSTDNPGPHPDGNGSDLFGRRIVAAELSAHAGGAWSCPLFSGLPARVTTSGAYVGSEDEVRNGVTYAINGPSLQLPNAALLTGQPVYLYSAAGATLTASGTLTAENTSGSGLASVSLKAGVLYQAFQTTGTAWYVQSVTNRTGNQQCFASGATYTGTQAFVYRQLADVCYSLNAATVTLTPTFGSRAQFYGAGGTSTLSLSSGAFVMPDGSTPTSLTLAAGQIVTLVGIITGTTTLSTAVVYDSGTSAVASQYSAPVSGATVVSNGGVGHLTHVIDPAGSLSALTVALPASPRAGSKVTYVATQPVGAVTFSGGTVVNAPAAFTAGQRLTLTYVSGQAKWY